MYRNNLKIHKHLVNSNIILSRGMYGRYILLDKVNVGLKYGSFISTRKFTNKPVYKKKR